MPRVLVNGVDVPAGSDYFTDGASTYVFDPSMESLGTVNEILCSMSMTAYDSMVNQGDFNAQVDEDLCDKGGSSDGAAAGQSSGAQGDNIEIYTVNSSRANRQASQFVHFWVPQEADEDGGDEQGTIRAKMEVTEGASDTNPFGAFSMDFASVPLGGSVDAPSMYGTLGTSDAGAGAQGFEFFSSAGDLNTVPDPGGFAHEVAVNVNMSSDQATGVARVRKRFRFNDPGSGGDSGIRTEQYTIAYNETHLKRQFGNEAAMTLSREDVLTGVWRYNLYHADGANVGDRVELNSGFGFRTEDSDYGFIGYYGMWVPDDVDIENGATIFEDSFGSTDVVEYTVLTAPGKLIRSSRNTLALTELGGTLFHWYDGGNNYQVEYDQGSFWKIAVFRHEDDRWETIPPEAIDVAGMGGYLNMWSEGLGGPVAYVDGDSSVTYFQEEFVNSASDLFDGMNGEVTLYGFVECLGSELTGTEVENGDVFLPNATDVMSPHTFRFGQTDLTLRYDSDGNGMNLTVVGLADGEEPTSGPYTWGMRSGPMVTDTSGLTDIWDVWNQEEFFTYETGHNTWNHYATAVDMNGDAVIFDAPLQFTYTHSQENDRNDDDTFAGDKYLLHYGGPGEFWGIPHEGVDLTGDDQPDRWYPLFSIADGVLVGPTGAEYFVRGIEMEQRLQEDPGGAPGLDLGEAAGLTLPTDADYQTPDIGTRPDVTGPPAVINGEVQGG